MSIDAFSGFSVSCDKCGEDMECEGMTLTLESIEEAKDRITDCDWVMEGGKVLCERCFLATTPPKTESINGEG